VIDESANSSEFRVGCLASWFLLCAVLQLEVEAPAFCLQAKGLTYAYPSTHSNTELKGGVAEQQA
jgi:hypothetical protein